MGLLGPNGLPIRREEPVSADVLQIVANARKLQEQGNATQALQQMIFAFQHDVKSAIVLDTTIDLMRSATPEGGEDANEELKLFVKLRENTSDATVLYQLGNRFAQMQQSFIARPFLARAQEIQGDSKDDLSRAIVTDLAQVFVDLGAYQPAIEAFRFIHDTYESLHVMLVLMMIECHALLRQHQVAVEIYDSIPADAMKQIPGGEQWYDEIGDLVARVDDWSEVEEDLGLREWHYVQTRGLLLETSDEEALPGGRWVAYQPSEEDVAYIVGLGGSLISEYGYSPKRILWLGLNSEPMARALAHWLKIPDENVRAYESGDNHDNEDDLNILCMAHSVDIFALPNEEEAGKLIVARAGLITFALDLHWTDRSPMTPDISGFMSQMCSMPWEPRLEVDEATQTAKQIEETRDMPTIVADIIAELDKLPAAEINQYATELREDYNPCTDLIINHRDGSLARRPFMTHSPIQSPRMM